MRGVCSCVHLGGQGDEVDVEGLGHEGERAGGAQVALNDLCARCVCVRGRRGLGVEKGISSINALACGAQTVHLQRLLPPIASKGS